MSVMMNYFLFFIFRRFATPLLCSLLFSSRIHHLRLDSENSSIGLCIGNYKDILCLESPPALAVEGHFYNTFFARTNWRFGIGRYCTSAGSGRFGEEQVGFAGIGKGKIEGNGFTFKNSAKIVFCFLKFDKWKYAFIR